MQLVPCGEGTYRAAGRKYYIGNGNRAAMISTFGKLAGSGLYVFFAVDSQHAVEDALIDQIFDVFVRDCSRYALQLHSKPASTPPQMEYCQKMTRKPVLDTARYLRVWTDHVYALRGAYAMNE
jgi:hypothetical protein